MDARIFQEFERICAGRPMGEMVLEVGALPNEESLLNMKSLQSVRTRIGLNLDGPYSWNGFTIVKGNANAMTCFADGIFDTVLCNAMLEHDKFFWKSLGEIKRVTRQGGLVVIGVPGYTERSLERRLCKVINRLPWIARKRLDWIVSTTLTYRIHNQPGDYYRFSPQAITEVFFDGMHEVEVRSLMVPPRIIASGIKN
jgi:SAM-dependent methyltransferase